MILLVGDIGGTKTILSLVQVIKSEKSIETLYEATYNSNNFPDLVPIVQNFLKATNQELPARACFAIAGPVINNTCRLTNLDWELDSKRLEKELNIPEVSLINDFAGVSYGILGLKDADLHIIQDVPAQAQAPIAVLGAGTGLGESFLIPQGSEYQVIATEGSHADFAPNSQLEWDLRQYLAAKYQIDHVSVERVVSGPGIVAIYQFLRNSRFAPESQEVGETIRLWEQEFDSTIDPAAVIAKAAIRKEDRLAIKTMEIFIEAYGAETGNLALKSLPYGGIYLAGGIAAKILPLMTDGRFLNAYYRKGRVSHLLRQIPLKIIVNPQVGLIGSVLYAMRHQV